MKKNFLIACAMVISTGLFAQELTSKKGEIYLPEGGDWALGFDAAPFLDYAGNFLGSGENSAPSADYVNQNMTIYGKMFRDAQTAWRAQVRLSFLSASQDSIVADLDPNALAGSTKTNTYKQSATNIVLGFGIEKRRGNTRLQGVYGAEALIGISSENETVDYGNAIQYEVGPRMTEMKYGSGFTFGARGFIGAEYFLFPKISIGAEYGIALGIASIGEGETTYEEYDLANNASVTTTVKEGGSSVFGLDTDNTGGSIRLMLHF